MERYPNVIGDFYWTSMDYLGEVGVGAVRYSGESEQIKAGFELEYEPGELLAAGYRSGVQVASAVLATAGAAAAIRLTPDRTLLKAQFGDLSYIKVDWWM